jgi:nicotinamidase-related amidase
MLPGPFEHRDDCFDADSQMTERIEAMRMKYLVSVLRMLSKIGARYNIPGPSIAERALNTVCDFAEPPAPRNYASADSAKADAAIEPSKMDLPGDVNRRSIEKIARKTGSHCGDEASMNEPSAGYTSPMPIPRLQIDDAAVLVIDMQERLMPTIVDADKVTHNCATLLQLAEVLGMPYLVTEQYPTGLGRTVEAITAAMEDQSRRIEKTTFSAGADIVLEQLHAWGRSSVIVCGLEAHVCVLQTVLDLQANGRQCFVCTDAVSAAQRDQIPHAYRRMDRAGAVLTGVLPTIYELLQDAKHPAFRACLDLAKAVQQ